MGLKRIFVTRKLPIDFKKIFTDFEIEVWEEDRVIPREVLEDRVKDVDILVPLLTDRIDEDIIEKAQNLKMIANYAAGYDNINVGACTERGIMVTNTPGVLSDATAELAWALVFAVARRVLEGDKFVREGKFRGWSPTLLLGMELSGKTLGVIGCGRIGTSFALKSKGLGMKVLYYNRSKRSVVEDALGAQKVDLEYLLRNSDVVSIHLPLTPETYHLIGDTEFQLMKENAILVNTARGAIVEERALIDALKNRKLFGAGLDVYENEPEISPELLKLDNVVLLPHIGSATFKTRIKMAELVVENIKAFLEGRRPPSIVNPEVLEK